MSLVNRASFNEWLDSYQSAYRQPALLASQRCPNCDCQSLRLIFRVANEDDPRATAIFWCDSCMYGLLPMRCAAPDESVGTIRDELVPNYRIVAPQPGPRSA